MAPCGGNPHSPGLRSTLRPALPSPVWNVFSSSFSLRTSPFSLLPRFHGLRYSSATATGALRAVWHGHRSLSRHSTFFSFIPNLSSFNPHLRWSASMAIPASAIHGTPAASSRRRPWRRFGSFASTATGTHTAALLPAASPDGHGQQFPPRPSGGN